MLLMDLRLAPDPQLEKKLKLSTLARSDVLGTVPV